MKWQIGLVCALSVFGLAMAQSQVSPGVSSSENFQLGLKYEREGEFPLAFLAYKRSGDSGNADGYLKIAKMYEEGQLGSGGDSEATGEQAVPWYQKAASSGNPEAQKWLASHSKLVQELALSTAAASTAASTASATALASVSSKTPVVVDWHPAVNEDSKNATWDQTATFLHNTLEVYSSSGAFGDLGSCRGDFETDGMSFVVQFAEVDPLSVGVNVSNAAVSFSGSNNGTYRTCTGGSCPDTTSLKRPTVIKMADAETSKRVARAFLHAALLCGGTKAVSPF